MFGFTLHILTLHNSFISHICIKFNLTSCSPISIIIALLHITVKTGIWPRTGRIYQSVFYRIVMDIINMPGQIILISNLMFPKTALPESLFTFIEPRSGLYSLVFILTSPAEITFNQLPSHRIVIVILWQRPNAMNMVGKQNKSANAKWVVSSHMQ